MIIKKLLFLLLLVVSLWGNTNTNVINESEFRSYLYDKGQVVTIPFKGYFFEREYMVKLWDENKLLNNKLLAHEDKIKKQIELLTVRDALIAGKEKEIEDLKKYSIEQDREIKLYKGLYKEFAKTPNRQRLENALWFFGGCIVTTGLVLTTSYAIKSIK